MLSGERDQSCLDTPQEWADRMKRLTEEIEAAVYSYVDGNNDNIKQQRIQTSKQGLPTLKGCSPVYNLDDPSLETLPNLDSYLKQLLFGKVIICSPSTFWNLRDVEICCKAVINEGEVCNGTEWNSHGWNSNGLRRILCFDGPVAVMTKR